MVDINKWAKVAESYNPTIASQPTDLSGITKQLEELSAKLERNQSRALKPEQRKNVQFQERVLNEIPSYRPHREQSLDPNQAVPDRQPRSAVPDRQPRSAALPDSLDLLSLTDCLDLLSLTDSLDLTLEQCIQLIHKIHGLMPLDQFQLVRITDNNNNSLPHNNQKILNSCGSCR